MKRSIGQVYKEEEDISTAPSFDPVQLAERTPHPLDSTIKFTEDDHKYYVQFEGETKFTCDGIVSTSTLIHDFFPHFDADKVITKMRKSTRWSQSKYVGMTNDEIKRLWDDNGKAASSRGTLLHFLLECHNNGYDLESSEYSKILEVQDYFRWRSKHFVGLRPFRTELRMTTGKDLKVTGTADLIAIDEDHPPPEECDSTLSLHLIDWKFSKAIKKNNPFENGYGVCSDLPSCNFSMYSLQQNIYQWMIERYYSKWTYNGKKYDKVKVVSKHLAIFHRNHSRDGFYLELPDMQKRVEKMMEVRRQQLNK